MLNITDNSIDHLISKDDFNSFKLLKSRKSRTGILRTMAVLFMIFIVFLFLPWTQNIRSKGYVTTQYPDERPQAIQAAIGGQIKSWHIREGQLVKAGDTILTLNETKQDYLDPQLLERTNSQIIAKGGSLDAYASKETQLRDQLTALDLALDAKLEQNAIKSKQVALKIQSDSIDLVAARSYLKIAQDQLQRTTALHDEGIKSLTQLEAKRQSVQDAKAKVIVIENYIDNSQNELNNLLTNRTAILNEYREKTAKTNSEIMSTRSMKFDTEANINKLQSSLNAYTQRHANFVIKAPIDGYITKTLAAGIGEIIKDGDKLATIVPVNYDLAVETYVAPQDMPLVSLGAKVRIQFDGWPAIVFSGWPNNSYGTFGGRVWAIDQDISENGMYRIMVAPDADESPWPDQIRIGGGANIIALLNNVSVGYELWRQLNGFPPDYYGNTGNDEVKMKNPIQKIK